MAPKYINEKVTTSGIAIQTDENAAFGEMRLHRLGYHGRTLENLIIPYESSSEGITFFNVFLGKNYHRDFQQNPITQKEEIYLNAVLSKIRENWSNIPKNEYDSVSPNFVTICRKNGYSDDFLEQIKNSKNIRFNYNFLISPETFGEVPVTKQVVGGDTGRIKGFYIEDEHYSWENARRNREN